MVKLFISDLDGVLTDGSMYYSSNGDESKRFSTYDGYAFHFLKEKGIKTAIITSEVSKINMARAKKMKVDFLVKGVRANGKLEGAKKLCLENNIDFESVSYIGDDINCYNLLSQVNYSACPANAVSEILEIPNVVKLRTKGGDGAVREYVDLLFERGLI